MMMMPVMIKQWGKGGGVGLGWGWGLEPLDLELELVEFGVLNLDLRNDAESPVDTLTTTLSVTLTPTKSS